MYRAQAEINGPFSPATFKALVDAFVIANKEQRIAHPNTPLLYQSANRVRYKWEPWVIGKGGEIIRPPDVFRDWLACLDAGEGNCKDFVAERVAELQLAGISAYVSILYKTIPASRTQPEERTLFHAVVGREGAPDEDPSLQMGMPANQLDIVDARYRTELGGRNFTPMGDRPVRRFG